MCMVGKGKNQADAAAGELSAWAGLGKRCSAHGQVGGPTAPLWQGGAGERNPVEGCPCSASSAEARSPARGRMELAGTAWSCNESSGKEAAPGRRAPRERKAGALLVTPYSLALPNPLPAFSSSFPACELPAPWGKLFWCTVWRVCWSRNG